MKHPLTIEVSGPLVHLSVRRGKRILLSGACEPRLANELEEAMRAMVDDYEKRERRVKKLRKR